MVPSEAVRLYSSAPTGVATVTTAVTARRIRNRGPKPSMAELQGKSGTGMGFPEISIRCAALVRSEPGVSLTGGDHSLASGRRLTPGCRLTTVGPLRNPVREEPSDGRLDTAHARSRRRVLQGAQ